MRLVLTDGQSRAVLGEFPGGSFNDCAKRAARKYKGMIARLEIKSSWIIQEEGNPRNQIPVSSVA